MASKINRICPFCGSNMFIDSYKIYYGEKRVVEVIAYCDNDNCPVKPCTDSTYPTKMLADLLAITGEKE